MDHQDHCIELTIPSESGYEQVARETAVSVAHRMGFGQDRIDALATAVDEACRNAIEHGNRGDDMLPVMIRFKMQPTSLRVDIADCGEGFETPPSPDIDAQVEGRQERRGWGVHLMEKLVDEVSFHRNEQGQHLTRLCLIKKEAVNDSQGDGY